MFSEFDGLPKYSYGESHYWSSNEWSHLDRPKDLIDVLAHFRRLFPTSNVMVVEELITVQTHKSAMVLAFGAHIFFDDQDIHTEPASTVVPAATVPYRDGDNPKE